METEDFVDWIWAFDLYIFAEKRFIPDLQNEVMDALLNTSQTWISWVYPEVETPRVWPEVSEGSPLRAYLVDVFLEVGELDKGFSEDKIDLFPMEFVAAIAVRAQQFRRQIPSGSEEELAESRCRRYHVHHRSEDLVCQKMKQPLFGFDARFSAYGLGKV